MRIFPVVVKRTTSLPSGTYDLKWNEEAEADDTAGVAWANPEAAEAADAVGLVSPQFPEGVQADDPWSLRDARGRWNEDADADDRLVLVPRLDEDAQVDGKLRLRPFRFDEDAQVDGKLRARPFRFDEDANADDLSRSVLANMSYGRSGTPDNDSSGDGWIDQASTGTNHGNEALQVKANVLSDERRGLIFFDFTRFASLTAVAGGPHSFVLHAETDEVAGNNNLRVRISTLAAKPFTESTLTWNTPTAGGPAEGTLRVNTTLPVAPAPGSHTISLTDTNVNHLLGNWVYVRLLSEAALGTTVFTVSSREAATVANRPTFNLRLRR